MFSTWLLSDVLATHVKCLFSVQNPPGSSLDTHYKLKSYSLLGLHDLALSDYSPHSFSASLASSLSLNKLGRLLPRTFAFTVPLTAMLCLNYVIVLHCRALPKYYLLEEAFPNLLKWLSWRMGHVGSQSFVL
ncbi:unnamed protein product [Pipistrellus nathusii]|uniref:Uncharacterized protein n=1 Tax=Pipistrellus nathusii TaxID=59473 RepID=A0ABN9Z8I4_PIPNA